MDPVGPRLRGQVALITGATRGIGLAIARALAAESCNLILTARDEKSLAKISRELASQKIKILAHPCDVRDPHSVDALFRAANLAAPTTKDSISSASTSSSTTPASPTRTSKSKNFHSPPGKTSWKPI